MIVGYLPGIPNHYNNISYNICQTLFFDLSSVPNVLQNIETLPGMSV